MFDYISADEVRLLCKLQLPGYRSCLSTNQRVRLELLGVVKEGPNGIQLTPKGVQVTRAGYISDDPNEFEPKIIRLPN